MTLTQIWQSSHACGLLPQRAQKTIIRAFSEAYTTAIL